MNRTNSPAPKRPAVLIEALEPRIAPAGLLNESKFTSVAVGGTLLLDASGKPGTFQGLTTGSGGGSGSYLLYITSGRALVYTTDLNGNGRLDPGEITGISLGKDSLGHDPSIILFSDVNGDIVTNLQGTSGATLTDSDHNPNNGRDGQLLTDTNIGSITLRTLTAADIDPSIPGNTVANRLALTSFSIHGNVDLGGSLGGLTIDTSGSSLLSTKFDGTTGDQLFTGATPTIGGIYTGTAADNLPFHFTQNNTFSPQVEGTIKPFHPPALEHGGDISNVLGASTSTTFSIGTLATGDGGTGARGGNLTNIVMHGDTGGYQLIAGDGGDGASGGQGGSILGFNDLGSITSEVLLHTGAGGTGLLGAGGAGGLATFDTTDIAAEVQVLMGRGGDGFGPGGDGASFGAGTFTTPETVIPVGGHFIGTWHNIGDVGNTHPVGTGNNISYSPEAVDFNGDGRGDGVFTTSAPDAVTVVFGNGAGGLVDSNGDLSSTISETIILKVPGVLNPVVTIGDFNNDGRPDIAVASQDPLSFSGIYVFLNQIGNATLNPVNGRDFTHNPLGDHPFSDPLQSALPTISPSLTTRVFQTSGAVYALAAGDFNGDGITDIAYVHNVTNEVDLSQAQTVGVLLGDGKISATPGKPVGSGYFYANTASPKSAPVLLNDSQALNGIDTLQATSLKDNNLPNANTGLPARPEVFFFASQGSGSFTEYSVPSNATTHVPTQGLVGNSIPVVVTGADTTNPTLEALTIQDFNQDGSADVVLLSKVPESNLTTYQQGASGFTASTNAPGVTGNLSVVLSTTFTSVTMVAVDAKASGTFNDVAVLIFPASGNAYIQEYQLGGMAGFTPLSRFTDPGAEKDTGVQGFDAFYAKAPDFLTGRNLHPTEGYGLLSPDTSDYRDANLYIFDSARVGLTVDRYLTTNGYLIESGGGGNSVTGVGGDAGTLGGTAPGVAGGEGAIAIMFPASLTYRGDAVLQGGNGGDGFGGGGIGGDVTGVTTRYASAATLLTSNVQVAGGNGGNGISGDGGRGGNLSSESLSTGDFLGAGNGGNGLHGGQGGSITGNQTGVYDVYTSAITLTTGTGGEGALGGGAGGNITKWDSEIANFLGTGGFLTYQTGSGGGAAGGTGGTGGSILNSSPDQTQNNLSGTLTLSTGAGGNGLVGGNGGAIATFINSSTTQSALPSELNISTGNGGIGVSGAGGTGGAIANFSSNATGLTSTSGGALVGIGRIIAGDGGISYGAAGGVGGSLTSIVATTTSAPLVVAAGAGGDGLTAGGDGGSVTNSTINSAALQIGKMLVVGGVGGNAFAAQPQDIALPKDSNTSDLAHTVLAFGGAQGAAGNGGDITNITQPVGAQTAVDLIAGNGGNTPNASTAITSSTGVGHGGSVTDVTLTGTVGAISRDTTQGSTANPPIQAYAVTDESGVTTTLPISSIIDLLASSSQIGAFNDTAKANALGLSISGNVGIVAGAAGTVRNAQPAENGVNGDVTGITAASIMSIVAGSVENVAPVRILSGITVTNSDGVLGADKSPTAPYSPNGALNYFVTPNSTTSVANLEAGYSLVGANGETGDGAIFASTITQTPDNLIRGPRVFSPAS